MPSSERCPGHFITSTANSGAESTARHNHNRHRAHIRVRSSRNTRARSNADRSRNIRSRNIRSRPVVTVRAIGPVGSRRQRARGQTKADPRPPAPAPASRLRRRGHRGCANGGNRRQNCQCLSHAPVPPLKCLPDNAGDFCWLQREPGSAAKIVRFRHMSGCKWRSRRLGIGAASNHSRARAT